MKSIPKYDFYKKKYGNELLIDVVELSYVKSFFSEKSLHFLTYYDITLITQGEGSFRLDDINYQAKVADVFFSLPYQWREWDTANITDGYALIFEEEFLHTFFNDTQFLHNISYFNKNRNNSKLSLSVKDFEQITSLIRQIKHEIDDYEIKNIHILRALLYQVLMQLDRVFIEQNGISTLTDAGSYVDKFYEFVNTYYNENHSVQYYAGKLHITPNYLNELVKRETGISAKHVIRNKLITEAKKFLLYSDLTITEIADLLAFESPSYFIRFFYKQTGCTPSHFRKTQKP